ncbi:glycosyltransferase [Fibrobacterota bacterium]
MKSPDITVLMCAYNEEEFIGFAIESILNQTFKDYEFIIINDGSKDETENIILKYSDPRLKYSKNKNNLGLTKSLNIGLIKAKSRYIARMDANDISHPNRLNVQLNVFKRNPEIDLVWCDTNYITKDGSFICKKASPDFKEVIRMLGECKDNFPVGRNHINHVSVMYKKEAVQEVGGYDEKRLWGQDGNLWCRMLKKAYMFYMLNETLIDVRLLPTGISAKRKEPDSVELNEYYSNVCINNGNISNATKFAHNITSGFRRNRQFLKIFYNYLKQISNYSPLLT